MTGRKQAEPGRVQSPEERRYPCCPCCEVDKQYRVHGDPPHFAPCDIHKTAPARTQP